MKRALRLVVLADVLFLLMLAVSGMMEGAASEITYYLAFALPAAGALYASRAERCERVKIGLDWRGIGLFLPIIAPTLLLIMGISYLTSLFLSAFGFSDNTVLEGNLFQAMLSYALLPAVFEELLFRYMPMRLLSPHSKRGAIIISSVFFALAHCDLFRIPYALFAGAVFISIDIACGSVLPSFIIHLMNNAVSVLFYFYPDSTAFKVTYLSVLGTLCVISVIFIVKQRRAYRSTLGALFTTKNAKFEFDTSILAFVIPTLFMAILNLF